ncbi:uncharacterized protein J3R85_007794 [Psidium guajava]|nr:uncharacterized protein J3R85_007794 [Psidium guajava]
MLTSPRKLVTFPISQEILLGCRSLLHISQEAEQSKDKWSPNSSIAGQIIMTERQRCPHQVNLS